MVGIATPFIINGHVKSVAKDRILLVEKATALEDVDCIIVLGCQVCDDGNLSHMLRDRLMRGLELYEAGVATKLLMGGDHGRKDYDEVGAMKNYAIENRVSSEDVFMDHAGFSTYETVYRAKEVFEADKVIIVTQKEILSQYERANGFHNTQYLVDDGYWGTSLDRPQFTKKAPSCQCS